MYACMRVCMLVCMRVCEFKAIAIKEKKHLKKEQKVGMLLQKRTRSRDK